MTENADRTRISIVFVIKIIALGMVIGSYFLFPQFQTEKWYINLTKGLNTFLLPSLIISIARVIIIALYNARHANRAVRGNFVLGINRLTMVINVTLAIIALMIALGINPKEFITSMTIVAMAIAVTFREYITNMISGLIIMFSEELSVGDRIRIGNHQGRILDINFASILLQDEEEDIVMVPNNLVFTTSLVNLSAHRSSFFSVRFELPISSASNIDLLEAEVRSLLLNHPNLAPDEEVMLKVIEVGKDFIRYKIDLHAVSSSNKLHKQLESEILKHVLKYEGMLSRQSD